MEDLQPENVGNYKPQKKRFNAVNILLGVLGLFIVLSLMGGDYAFRMHKKMVMEQVGKKDSLQTALDGRDLVYEEKFKKGVDSVKKLNVQRKSYYNEMLHFKSWAEALESELQGIDNNIYDTAYLDSLARHIKYRPTN